VLTDFVAAAALWHFKEEAKGARSCRKDKGDFLPFLQLFALLFPP
jgi:hypothetical protein